MFFFVLFNLYDQQLWNAIGLPTKALITYTNHDQQLLGQLYCGCSCIDPSQMFLDMFPEANYEVDIG
jgi:hypothetical protein